MLPYEYRTIYNYFSHTIQTILYNDAQSQIFTNLSSSSTISGNYYVGGIIGNNYGEINNSYSTGSVSGNYYVGGIIGNNYGEINNSFSTGSVSGNKYVGGITGKGDVENSYSTGQVFK